MTNPRKTVAAALAATMAITLLSISTSASAWARCGGDWEPRQGSYDGMVLGAVGSDPCSYGYYGSAYLSMYG